MTIVVIEDEPLVRDLVAMNLRHAGFDVETEATFAGGVERLLKNPPALAIIDMMLPDGDGVALAKHVRAQGFHNPILMLTARNEPGIKVASFDAGVDDYLTKPFNVPELMARVRALLRREAPKVEEQLGVLLINIGTPKSTSTGDVRRYLREFLSDPRVIDISPIARFLLVNAIIAPFRAPKSAHAYKKVWTEGGSPLLVHSRAQADALQAAMPQHVVRLGMRYGDPSIESALADMTQVDRLVIMPLYPQYSSAATGSSVEEVIRVIGRGAVVPALTVVPPFYDAPQFLDAYLALIHDACADFKPDHLLLSYHGLPARQVRATASLESSCQRSPHCCEVLAEHNKHCYRAQSYATSRAIAKELKIPVTTSFQSRLGRTPWIPPYSDVVVPELVQKGVKRLLVACPSFVTDCLETLEEVGMRLREDFLKAGGEDLKLVSCLNAHPRWIAGMQSMVLNES